MSATAVQNRTLPGPTSNPYEDNEDRYTVPSSASTAYTMASQYTANTDNYRDIPISSRLSRHTFKIRSTSSFPSILNMYQEPITEELSESVKKEKPKKNKRHVARSSSKTGIDWSGLINTEPRKSENRAIRIEAIAREQMEKYEIYIKNLHNKVDRQRSERTRREELFEERMKAREEEERLKYAIRKRPKQNYIHDKKYLKKLPKSKFSKMVKLSDDLQKKGVLKNQHEVDKFWTDFGEQGITTDIFKRDPLKEVPDSTSWVAEKPSPRKPKHKPNKTNISVKIPTDKEEDDTDTPADDVDPCDDSNVSRASDTAQSPEHKGRRRKSKKGHNLPPLDKKREKHRKKAKSWPDRDPGALDEPEPITAREI